MARKQTVEWWNLEVNDSPHSYIPTVIGSYATRELAEADLDRARFVYGWRVKIERHHVTMWCS